MDKFAEEDNDLDMPDGSGTSSRLVFKLIHPRIVNRCRTITNHHRRRRLLVPRSS